MLNCTFDLSDFNYITIVHFDPLDISIVTIRFICHCTAFNVKNIHSSQVIVMRAPIIIVFFVQAYYHRTSQLICAFAWITLIFIYDMKLFLKI